MGENKNVVQKQRKTPKKTKSKTERLLPEPLVVHRTRIPPRIVPGTVSCLAFTPSDYQGQPLLAVGRHSPSRVEIWSIKPRITMIGCIPGDMDSPLQSLFWMFNNGLSSADNETGKHSDPSLRLFGGLWTGFIVEFDFRMYEVRHRSRIDGRNLWSLISHPTHPILVSGSDDGSIRLWDVSFPGVINPLCALVSAPSRVCSLAFSPDGNTLYAGLADSTIRVYNIQNGEQLLLGSNSKMNRPSTFVKTLSVGKEFARSKKKITVWALLTLPDNALVSADSSGQIVTWDAKTYTPIDINRSNEADVLNICASKDGQWLFSVGVDRRVRRFQRIDEQWMLRGVAPLKSHDHDIRAISVWIPLKTKYSGRSRKMEHWERAGGWVATGGIDRLVSIHPIAQFPAEDRFQRGQNPLDDRKDLGTLPLYFPTNLGPLVSVSKAKRWIVFESNRKPGQSYLQIWSLASLSSQSTSDSQLKRTRDGAALEASSSAFPLLDIVCRLKHGNVELRYLTISDDGAWLCAVYGNQIFLFELRQKVNAFFFN